MGKIHSKRLLQHMSAHMPTYVTGFLQGSGRGAKEASYRTQSLIETHRASNTPCAGFTLDLKKCYNLIPRKPLEGLMTRVGVPPEITKKWLQGLGIFRRRWEVTSNVGNPGTSTTGIPEGDPLNIVAMLSVAEVWATTVAKLGARPQAYADNWSWASTSLQINAQALRATIKVTKALRQTIDWQKSHCWSTDTALGKKWQATQKTILPPGVEVPKMQALQDLGCPITYQRSVTTKSHEERFQKAEKKLQRIGRLRVDFEVKCKLITSNVLPTALYGAELTLLPDATVQRLRARIVQALLGEKTPANPAIFLALASNPNNPMDPGLANLLQALRSARQFLLTEEEDTQQQFLDLARQHKPVAERRKGPAEVLGKLLRSIGWQIDRQGQLHTTALQTIDLRRTSYRRLRRAATQAWSSYVLPALTTRKELHQMQPICLQTMWTVIKKFKGGERQLLLRELSHAFQSEAQKAHWAADADGKCPHCGEDATDEHRLLWCPMIQEPLLQHAVAREALQDRTPMFYALPAHYQTTTQETHQALHDRHGTPELPQDIRAACHTVLQTAPHLEIYTDGSAQSPAHPAVRHSAYAICIDTAPNDQERLERISQPQFNPSDHFMLAAMHRTEGDQDIFRAELQAIASAMAWRLPAKIFSDNQAACNMVKKCSRVPRAIDLHKHEHFDVLQKIWSALHDPTAPPVEVVKIKAHRDINTLHGLDRYNAWGNALADQQAQQGAKELAGPMAQSLSQECEDHERAIHELEAIYKYLVEAAKTRPAILHQNEQPRTRQSRKTTLEEDALRQKLDEWTVHPRDRMQARPRGEVKCDAYPFGTGLGKCLLQWMQAVRWPTAEAPVNARTPGISWLEMCISFMEYAQCWLPSFRKDKDGEVMISRPETNADAHALRIAWAEASTL